jgi:5-phospho-D-xylono-1,4-lactonase
MSFVRTVLGDIRPEDLGVCYAHEHVIIDPSVATESDPSFLLDDVDLAVQELRAAYAVGVRAMIDTMPGGAGRNAHKLAQVSRASGVHIVCPTGLHLAKYYRADDPLLALNVDALANWFIEEITEGVADALPSESEYRPCAGVIKIASGLDKFSDLERKAFAAAAIAHRETCCPIITHTDQGTAAMEQIDLLEAAGVDLSRLTLSHTDRLPNSAVHRALLRRGVKLEYDSCFRWKAHEENHSLRLLIELAAEFPEQLMLGMDAARRGYLMAYSGSPGLQYLAIDFRRQLEKQGVKGSLIRAFFIGNPAKAFSFAGSP